ncbi:GNAT family N-acetyltransferase [Acidimangrovimonas sediminis]|uniref:GNAT family N-acetyltransferase n=1 Tax=Acidimangrovimonas sediminis TaxID=2056283 RepID=UPI000C80146F|nr:GNAT family N-acetyltransferase [Acidimangrovimonas sediminis]
MTDTAIRWAQSGDEAAWRGLWASYLEFYATALPEAVTAATWARCLDPAHPMGLRLALVDGVPAGFALHLSHASSWSPADDCYLEDLFVDAKARGTGLGRALIEDLRELCRDRGWSRLYWLTGRSNARARALYDSFTPTDDHLRYRLDV